MSESAHEEGGKRCAMREEKHFPDSRQHTRDEVEAALVEITNMWKFSFSMPTSHLFRDNKSTRESFSRGRKTKRARTTTLFCEGEKCKTIFIFHHRRVFISCEEQNSPAKSVNDENSLHLNYPRHFFFLLTLSQCALKSMDY